MLNFYDNLIFGEIRLSSKAIESLEKDGIYEFQCNVPNAGLYTVSLYRDYQTDEILMLMHKKSFDHLFTFKIPSHLSKIKVGKEVISIKFL
jgi:hypothetical protein